MYQNSHCHSVFTAELPVNTFLYTLEPFVYMMNMTEKLTKKAATAK